MECSIVDVCTNITSWCPGDCDNQVYCRCGLQTAVHRAAAAACVLLPGPGRRTLQDPSVFTITENAFMFVFSSSTITRRTGGYRRMLQDKAGGDTRPLPPGRDIHSIIHRFTFVLIVSVISQVDTDFTDGRGTTLCNTQVNCINMTTIFSPLQFFFIILSGKYT